MWRLFYPLRYFRLRADGKAHLDLIPTVILAALMAGPFVAFGGVFFNPDGFLDKLINVTAALGGFYVAALVAAATFTHEDLDKVIRSGPIALIEKDADGHAITEYLTRRELACAIFGYLAFSSILFSFAAAFAVGMSRNSTLVSHLIAIGGDGLYLSIRSITIILFSLVVAHIATVTGVGLYYLMDRLYRHDRAITTPKGGGRIDDVA
ncbi:hypothetical protein [Bradyrhizobium sp. Arg816]|uniref:hypothetical protein n=1 Tax=Bradyrhizobium sp. Arg816 TaxID=2998491 RepID=UPI00249E0BC8|nr:hypothetical protein [Bradyrhizobium sp. Arg816]MDI3566652.1 hypothetical protein [Bradyrhizobium sp. Arg816]